MTKKGIVQSCLICEESSSTIRFGAVSCRACAEFFRRIVISKKPVFQRCSGSCDLSKAGRKTCKTCRFEKCLNAGMQEKLVLSRVFVQAEDALSASITEDLHTAYQKLKDDRKKVFGEVSPNPTLNYCNHKEFDDVFSKDIGLIMCNFVSALNTMTTVGKDQKDVLEDHFIVPFVLLETTFRSFGHPSNILPNGQVFDSGHLDQLYEESVNDNDNSRVILQPYWNSTDKVLKEPMDRIQLDLTEMLLLSGLIYCDFGIPNQSDDCIQKCQEMRNKIFKELIDYEKSKHSDHSMRIIDVMSILQGLEKASNTIKSCAHVVKMYDLKGKTCPLYEVMDN